MEIPYKSISVLEIYSSSRNSKDPNNLLHIRCNVFPFDISAEGTLNIIFEHVEDNLENKAAWPWKIGSDSGDNS